jgi:RNA polymerase sigma-70 factor, ECF subfamily
VTEAQGLTRLALEARDGDDVALRGLVDGAYDQVRRLCAMLVDEQGAEDLAQETFVRAVRALGSFQASASARTWLLTIARNTCMDELRSRTRRRRRDASLRAAAGERTVPDASQQPVVADLLGRLEPERRAAFVLTQVLGLGYRDAARVCSCPVGTIRSRVARARADLLALLGDESATAGSRFA